MGSSPTLWMNGGPDSVLKYAGRCGIGHHSPEPGTYSPAAIRAVLACWYGQPSRAKVTMAVAIGLWRAA
jgi:hypothetical protein